MEIKTFVSIFALAVLEVPALLLLSVSAVGSPPRAVASASASWGVAATS